jgi:hypothetical protein
MSKATIEERLEKIEKDTQRNKDMWEVQNLMNRYEYLLSHDQLERIPALFSKRDDVRVQISTWGIWEGPQAIYDLMVKNHTWIQRDETNRIRPGSMFMNTNCGTIIEIAGDGKTAKGVWVCPGLGTPMTENGLVSNWQWCIRGTDFIKEDGEWKIWHYLAQGLFSTGFDKPWSEIKEASKMELKAQFFPCPPNRPSVDPWEYRQDIRLPYWPTAPEPYESFDETNSYVK